MDLVGLMHVVDTLLVGKCDLNYAIGLILSILVWYSSY